MYNPLVARVNMDEQSTGGRYLMQLRNMNLELPLCGKVNDTGVRVMGDAIKYCQSSPSQAAISAWLTLATGLYVDEKFGVHVMLADAPFCRSLKQPVVLETYVGADGILPVARKHLEKHQPDAHAYLVAAAKARMRLWRNFKEWVNASTPVAPESVLWMDDVTRKEYEAANGIRAMDTKESGYGGHGGDDSKHAKAPAASGLPKMQDAFSKYRAELDEIRRKAKEQAARNVENGAIAPASSYLVRAGDVEDLSKRFQASTLEDVEKALAKKETGSLMAKAKDGDGNRNDDDQRKLGAQIRSEGTAEFKRAVSSFDGTFIDMAPDTEAKHVGQLEVPTELAREKHGVYVMLDTKNRARFVVKEETFKAMHQLGRQSKSDAKLNRECSYARFAGSSRRLPVVALNHRTISIAAGNNAHELAMDYDQQLTALAIAYGAANAARAATVGARPSTRPM
jgi:hypothetical protein